VEKIHEALVVLRGGELNGRSGSVPGLRLCVGLNDEGQQ
jgi:hypothetical protein